MIERTFKASRVVSEFLKDDTNIVQLLFGCVGSGKSSACVVKIWQQAMNMPSGHDGVKRSRWAVIRKTYSQLATTTVKTWQEWLPSEAFGKVTGNSPLYHNIKQPGFELEVVFLAIETLDDVDKIKSFELTGAYVNEAQFFYDKKILGKIRERTNRYPGNILGGGLKRELVILDCNPPSQRHWIYQTFEIDKPYNFKIYKMPAALLRCDDNYSGENGEYAIDTNNVKWRINPAADFIDQVPDKNYWLSQVTGNDTDHIKIELCGEYGVHKGGRPVHPEYNDSIHYANHTISAVSQVKLGFGWDFGNTPAMIITQFLPNGQLVVLDELWTEYMQLRTFLSDVVIPHLDKNYVNWRGNHESIHDPSGEANLPGAGTCQTILAEFDIKSQAAPTNDLAYRRDGLKYFLKKLPPFLLSNKCEFLREGLQGEFQFELIKSTELSGDKQYKDRPKKNIFSHACEALEYIAAYYAPVNKKPKREKIHSLYRGSFMGI